MSKAKTKTTVYLAAQQGGASAEWYMNTYDTKADAEQAVQRWKDASYNGIGPIPVEIDEDLDKKMTKSGAWSEILRAMSELIGEAVRL